MAAPVAHGEADRESAQRAVALAAEIVNRALELQTSGQRRRATRLARLISTEEGRAFLLGLTDRVMRVRVPHRAGEQFDALTDDAPRTLGWLDRMMLRAGATAAHVLPAVVMKLVRVRVRREVGHVLVPAEPARFARHARARRAAGVRLNVNVLGEAVLGDGEAARRLDAVLTWLRRHDVDYVSVKISAVTSQLSVLAFEDSVQRIASPLRTLYRTALETQPAKFVNLDMEDYQDLWLTIAAFCRVLDEPEFLSLDAGIVLQAYLPDAHDAARALCEWAAMRRAAGGGRIKIRVVKGANLAMERVEAELAGWPQSPYTDKTDVDASFKRLLDALLEAQWADCVRIGVATHNPFDAAWAIVRAEAADARERVDLEMLEGIADAQAAALVERWGGVVMYAPLVRDDDFDSAIAYLVRRLDENSGPQNYLRHGLEVTPDSAVYAEERARFLDAVARRHSVTTTRRRTQDRSTEARQFEANASFTNEPDTDFALPANRAWVAHHFETVTIPDEVAPIVDGQAHFNASLIRAEAIDPNSGSVGYRVVLADLALVDRAVDVARRGLHGWAARSWRERRAILHRVAEAMARERGATIAVMAHDSGKTVAEGDPEVSEAIDMANYYAASTNLFEQFADSGVTFAPHGVVVVAAPWNFPYAIPAGGVLAALAAGNAVILKPAPETVLTATLLAQHCWSGGVPQDVLQLLPCPDDDVGRHLITHDAVDAVVLTGAWETARLFRTWKPGLRLFAETSGKNAIVISATADLDAAVDDLVHSAFGHAGQKCSAASLAIVEAGLYDDERFARQLRDAVSSLRVGAGWDVRTTVGPLIRPPQGPLADALGTLHEGEGWLVQPRQLGDNPHLWSPGVKLGVRPGSPFHVTECFGPVLGLMRADDLDHALALQNATPFGLTGGIHSLDDDEIAAWCERVDVGNAYVNRRITGAIVQRQPFGGWKRSVVGPSFKAGGPHTLLNMGRLFDERRPPTSHAWSAALDLVWASDFGGDDPSGLRAERNLLRFRPFPNGILLRGEQPALGLAGMAATRAGTRVVMSDTASESDAAVAERVCNERFDRLRVLGSVTDAVRSAADAAEVTIDDSPFVAEPRVELARWVREQAISWTRHRHGNLLERDI